MQIETWPTVDVEGLQDFNSSILDFSMAFSSLRQEIETLQIFKSLALEINLSFSILRLESCRRGNSPAGWQNAPALNPKMRRGLSVLPVRWSREEHKNTRGFRVVRAVGA
jgi:hypothetical protein